MVETHADAMRGFGEALRGQECEEGPTEDSPRDPTGTDNCRRFMMKGRLRIASLWV